MRDVLEAMHDYPDEALGLFFFLIVIVWLLSGVFEKVIIYQFTPLPTNNHKLYKYYLC